MDVTQWRTRTEKRISELQHIRQIQAASPLRTIRIVRLLFGFNKGKSQQWGLTYTTLEVRVPRLPAKERKAIVRRAELGLLL